MGKVLDGGQVVPLEEVVLAQTHQLETLPTVLERREVVWNAEAVREIKRLRAKSVKAR
jgi:hypothetical protein